MNCTETNNLSFTSRRRHALTTACTAGLLALGMASSAGAVTGGQGGAGTAHGGAYNSGGQSGDGSGGVPGSSGKGGDGGNSSVASGGVGGNAGIVPNMTISVLSSVTGAPGGSGNAAVTPGNGGGGGGGGDGAFIGAGLVLTVNPSVLVSAGVGGNGGSGFNAAFVGGGGGGGGSGVELQNASLANYGTIIGGKGGAGASGSALPTSSGGGGGGNGVVVSVGNVTIINGGTISAGAAGDGGSGGQSGTKGDAILFNGDGGFNNLGLFSSSVISGDIESASGTVHIYTKNSAVTLSSNILLDSSSLLYVTTNPSPLTITGVVSGSGYLQVAGSTTLTLSGTNTFTGGSNVYSGKLQVDGSIGDVNVGAASLGGNGTVGNITLSSSGAIVPGGSPGTLEGSSLLWNGGGVLDFQLGATNSTTDTDLLALSGGLTKGDTTNPTFKFHLSSGNGTPTQGTTYTLISFGSNSGFSAGDFSFDTDGTFNVCAKFSLTGSALQFTVRSVTPDYIFCSDFE